MRISAGEHRGRRLRSPKGLRTRPTSDLLRQAMFNVVGARIQGARVLDLFAGTGALGLEALSRGAADATFVERDRQALVSLRTNLAHLGLTAQARVLAQDALAALAALARAGAQFDYVFLDPPYDGEDAIRCVEVLALDRILSENAVLLVQTFSAHAAARAERQSVARVAAALRRQPAERVPEGVCMSVTAVYPGTFDPFTNGHSDLLRRARRLFPRLILAVARNPQKSPLFTLDERLAMAREAAADFPDLEIDTFDILTVDYVRSKGAQVIVRGVRAVSDFEFEFAMALMNRKISEDIETVFLMPNQAYTYLSSRLVKEVALLGGNVEDLVPPLAAKLLKERASQPRLSGKREA